MSDPNDTQTGPAVDSGAGFQAARPGDDVPVVEGTTIDVEAVPADGDKPAEPAKPRGSSLQDLVDEPAKVMRIGTMIRQLLEEVKSAPLDDAARGRLAEIHERSIKELEDGLAPELVAELNGSVCLSRRTGRRLTPNSASPRPSWSAGLKDCSTAFKRP